MTRISVVIATRNRPGPLAACLRALAESFPDDAETIVVFDGTPATSGLGGLAGPLRLRFVEAPAGGPAAARNRGLAEARGDVVAFTDDDCLPRPEWPAALAAGVSASPPVAAGGTTLNGSPANAYADCAQLILDLAGAHDLSRHGTERFFAANNVAFPAEPLRSLGGFAESFRTAEDRELCRRWRDAGFALRSVPEAVVEHRPALDFRGFVEKCFAYGRGAEQFHSTEPGSLREAAAFHLQLPAALARATAGRGALRRCELTALSVVWEVANLAGFVSAWSAGRR